MFINNNFLKRNICNIAKGMHDYFEDEIIKQREISFQYLSFILI